MNETERDILIRVDQNVKNLAENFHNHVKADDMQFNESNGRLKTLEKAYWIGLGVIAAFQALVLYIK